MDGLATAASDVWSFGVILNEMVMGKVRERGAQALEGGRRCACWREPETVWQRGRELSKCGKVLAFICLTFPSLFRCTAPLLRAALANADGWPAGRERQGHVARRHRCSAAPHRQGMHPT